MLKKQVNQGAAVKVSLAVADSAQEHRIAAVGHSPQASPD